MEDGVQESVGKRDYLDPVVWKSLQQAGTIAEFSRAWLTIQMGLLPSVTRAAVVSRQEENYAVVSSWPEGSEPGPELIDAAERAIREGKGVAKTIDRAESGAVSRVLAYPIVVDGVVQSVPVLEVTDLPENQVLSTLRALQWGASQFESHHFRLRPQQAGAYNERMRTALTLLTSALEEENFTRASFAVATELAAALGCERVSVGFLKGSNVQVKALSNSSTFDKKTNIMRAIGDAMDEAMDQQVALTYPHSESETAKITRAQQHLVHESGAASVCTVPLSKDGKVIGGITLEHSREDFFEQEIIDLCEQAALLLGPLLELQRLESRLIIHKAWDSLNNLGKRLLGTGHYTLKLWFLILSSVVLFFCFATTDYQVRAESTVEGYQQRHLSAPIDGYISSSEVRPGDIVKQGDSLFKLDNKDLLLEREKWASQSLQIEKQYRDAMQRREKDKVGIFRSQLNQAKAQLALVEEQLARTAAVAPFDGVIISGDLSQRLGSPVSKGETLMQIAPLSQYRVILKVDERDITQLQEGDEGELLLAAMPDQPLSFLIEKITPVSTAEEGVNRFRVEARLDTQSRSLRPGMQGKSKVDVGERKLIWVWTHRFNEWLKLKAWIWLP